MPREMIPLADLKRRMSELYRAIDINAQLDLPHDKMYEMICKGWDIGGVKSCELLERYAVEKHGFDRTQISWVPEYFAKFKRLVAEMTPVEPEDNGLPF